MKEKRLRSVAKGVVWRVLATITTFILAFLVFHSDPYVYEKAGLVAALEVITKLILYYFHERFWLRVKWGVDGSVE